MSQSDIRASRGSGDTMELLRVHGVQDMRLDTVPVPEVGPDDVLVKVRAVGVCGTDLGVVATGGLGNGPLAEPLPIGHEFAGVVERVGANVSGIAAGQRCAVNPDSGTIGCGGPTGAFAPYILVSGAKRDEDVFILPDGVSFERAALAEPLSVALHGLNVIDVEPRSKVVVIGAGPIGLCAVVCLRARGVEDIVVADLSDARLDRAMALGARHVVNPSREALAEKLAEYHGAIEHLQMPCVDTDCFIDAAGSPAALDEIMNVAKYRARISVIALHKKPFPVNLWKMMANELTLAGSIAINRADEFGQCLEMLADSELDLGPLISHRVPFGRVHEAFSIAANADESAKVVVEFA